MILLLFKIETINRKNLFLRRRLLDSSVRWNNVRGVVTVDSEKQHYAFFIGVEIFFIDLSDFVATFFL